MDMDVYICILMIRCCTWKENARDLNDWDYFTKFLVKPLGLREYIKQEKIPSKYAKW